MTTPTIELSPRRLARTAGVLFLVLAVLGPVSMLYVPGEIVVPDDATATGDNLRASGGLLQVAAVVDMAIMLIELVMPVLLYLLLRPVSRTIALIAAFARVGEALVIGVSLVAYFLALRLARGSTEYLDPLDAGQRDALALLVLDGHADGVYIGQVFFGFSLLALGYLVHRAGYFPRLLGILLLVAALGYLSDGIGSLLWSGYGDVFGWVVGVTAVVGEVPFFLWLLVKGVDMRAWNDRVRTPEPERVPAPVPRPMGR
jgi:Domain of unknown function (DUF4386)